MIFIKYFVIRVRNAFFIAQRLETISCPPSFAQKIIFVVCDIHSYLLFSSEKLWLLFCLFLTE